MKKIKKALKNNLLRLSVKNPYFVIKNNLQKKIDLEAKTLTGNTVHQTGVNRIIDVSSLKFPMVLKTFKNFEDLRRELVSIERSRLETDLVIVKHNNLFFKNKVSNIILVKQDAKKTFVLFQNLTSKIVGLLNLLKLQQKASS